VLVPVRRVSSVGAESCCAVCRPAENLALSLTSPLGGALAEQS